MPSFAAILPAAGQSTRFGGPRNKLFEDLAGEPVIVHSLRAFLRRADVAAVIVASNPAGWLDPQLPPSLRTLLADSRVRLCAGGANRADSVRKALAQTPAGIEWVAVHDAARPLVSQELIDRTFAAATTHGAAVPALPVALTIKQAVGPLPAKVLRTVPRHELWAMQTPQIMRRAILASAFDACPLPLEQITDDVQLLELAGQDVWLVAGEERNLKVTTPLDLRLAELLLSPLPQPK